MGGRLVSDKSVILFLLFMVFVSSIIRYGIPQSLVEGQDDFTYHNFALRMLEGEPFPGGYFWPPGMSFFLYGAYSLFGMNVRLLLIAVSVASAILLYLIARELSGEKIVGVLAFTLFLFDPDVSHYSVQLYSEGVYNLLVLAVIYSSIRLSRKPEVRYALLAGVCTGLAAYQKVFSLGFLLIIPVYLILNRSPPGKHNIKQFAPSLKASFVICLTAFLIIAPWIVKIYLDYGVFVLMTASSGVNLFIGNNPYATGCYTNAGFENHLAARERISELAEDELKPYYTGKILGEIARRHITGDPAAFATKLGSQFLRHWLIPNQNCWRRLYKPPLYISYTQVLWFLTVFGLVLSFKTWRVHSIIYMYALLVILTSLIVFAGARHGFPLTPVRLMLSAYTLNWAYNKHKSDKTKAVLILLILLIAYMLAANSTTIYSHGFSDFHEWMGYTFTQQQLYPQAIWETKTALSLKPSSVNARSNLGKAYYELGDLEGAAGEYERILEYDSSSIEAFESLASIYFLLGRIEDSAGMYEAALEIEPNDSLRRKNLGEVYYELGDFTQAISEFNEALKLDPALVDARVGLGSAYLQAGMLDESIVEFEEALKSHPKSSYARNNLGTAYYQKGLYDQAARNFREALKLDPKEVNTYLNLALAYVQSGRYPEALSELERLLELDPKNRDARVLRDKLVELIA